METKRNQTFFHETYSNLTSYTFLSKNIKVFQWLSKSKFPSFFAKVNRNSKNETKSDIFPWEIFKSDIIFHFCCKILNYFFDFYSWHLSIPLQKQAQTSKIKSNQMGHVKMWQHLSYLLYLNKFWNFITWYVLSRKWMITVRDEKCPSFNFIP